MILVTGGTGFIGNVLIQHLSTLGYPVKLLIRPSKTTPNLPKGQPLHIAVTSLSDQNGLRAAMKDVDVVYHLASAESQETQQKKKKTGALQKPELSDFFLSVIWGLIVHRLIPS